MRISVPGEVQMSPAGAHVAFTVKRTDTPSTYATRIAIAGTGARASMRHVTAGPRDSTPRWSPDGTSIAFVRAATPGHPQIALIPLSPKGRAGRVRTLSRLPEGKFGDIRWSPDGLRIAFAFRPTPDERTSAAAKARARQKRSTPPMEVTDPWYRLDGDGYFGRARFALHLLDVRTGAVSVIDAKDTMGTFSFDWSPDGGAIVISTNRSPKALLEPSRSELRILGLDDRGMRVERDIELRGLPAGPKAGVSWSPDGSRIAWAGRQGHEGLYSPENLELWALDLTTGTVECATAGADVCLMAATLGDTSDASFAPSFVWMPDARSVLARIGWNGSGHIASIDVDAALTGRTARRDESRVRLHTMRGAEHSFSAHALSRDGYRLALVRTSPCEPPEVAVATVEGVEFPVRTLTRLNDALVDELDLSMPEERWVRTRDGTLVHCWVMRPPVAARAPKRHPAILSIHGGPHAQYGNVFFHEMQVMAAAGHSIWYPNPRGSKGYGRAHCAAIRGAWGTADWTDVRAVADAMQRDSCTDPARMGIMGGSYGGYMTNWAVAHDRRFRAAVTDRCVSNLISHAGNSDYPEIPGEYWRGMPWHRAEELWRASPIAHMRGMRTPMLVIHSAGDLRCNIEQGEQVHAALVTQHVPCRFVRYPAEASHGLSRMGPPDLRLHRLHEYLAWWSHWFALDGGSRGRKRGTGASARPASSRRRSLAR